MAETSGESNRPEPTDQELVRRVLDGSDDAFYDLVVRYEKRLFGLVVRMVRNGATAEDIVQEAFVKAYRSLGSYDPRRKLSSWLFKIAHNTAIDHLRRGRLETVPLETSDRGSFDPVDHLEDGGVVDPEERAIGQSLRDDIEGAIEALDPHYREMLLLRFAEGLSYQEIAEILDVPMGTVKVRIHRGRKRLAELLTKAGWDV